MTGSTRDPILQLERICYVLHKNDVGEIEVHHMKAVIDHWDEEEYNAKVEIALNDILKLPKEILDGVI